MDDVGDAMMKMMGAEAEAEKQQERKLEEGGRGGRRGKHLEVTGNRISRKKIQSMPRCRDFKLSFARKHWQRRVRRSRKRRGRRRGSWGGGDVEVTGNELF
jgi:hypothetical protein